MLEESPSPLDQFTTLTRCHRNLLFVAFVSFLLVALSASITMTLIAPGPEGGNGDSKLQPLNVSDGEKFKRQVSDGELRQIAQLHPFQGRGVSGLQDHGRGHVCLKGLLPTSST